MTILGLSTIAQLLFADENTLDFARIVSELEVVLSRLRGDEVEIAWDCDDLVIFDIPDTRILLAWTDNGHVRLGGCLTVSVGPSPVTPAAHGGAEHDVLCSRLVERIQGRFDAVAVLWCQVTGPVNAEVVDALMDTLPEFSNTLPSVESILDGLSRADLQMANMQVPVRRPYIRQMDLATIPTVVCAVRGSISNPNTVPEIGVPELGVMVAANDQPDLPMPRNAELARLRLALYPPDLVANDVAYSTQMRLAAHCMNATLILVWAPLGAAVMTYSVLKGENMRLSSRMMAVSGTLFALAHSPVGQTMAAMAKGIV